MTTELAEGTVIDGKYRVQRRLAEGGMGQVFVAEHLLLRKAVALKVLHPEMSAQPDAVERFTVEARAASLIEHENVVRVSDFGRSADGQLYLVMELLKGHTLASELEKGPLSPTRARFIAREMLRGLEAAHARGVVHRDLKPENVFITPRDGDDDAVKLLDFGIARMRQEGADESQRLTKDGAVMGTPLYMAPEQLKGARDVDARADLYAVGVMLYEMLAGKPPYFGDTFGEIAYQILDAKPRPLAEAAPAVDGVLAALVMRAFAGARDRRFATANELRGALERHRIDEPLGGPTPSPYLTPRASQLRELPDSDAATLSARRGAGAAVAIPHAPTLDGNSGALPSVRSPTTPPRVLPLAAEAVALELDRPPPSAPQPTAPPPRRRLGVIIAVAGVVAVLAALAGARVLFAGATAPPPPTAVDIRVADLPRGAHVFVDGAASSASFTMPGDREQHRLRLQASGYADKAMLFVPDASQTIDGRMIRSR
jgi:eukaryotic-like serine/threonine-protein kinase